jgi:SecD/SecF fusion protein
MRKSLTLRFALIICIMLAWGVSLHPLKDRPFIETFEKLAVSRIEKYRAESEAAAAEVETLKSQLEALADSESEEAGLLRKELAEAEAALAPRKKLVTDYDETIAKARELLAREDGQAKAEYNALRLAAQGTEVIPSVPLHKYVPVAGVPQASNSLVISHVRGKSKATLRKGLDLAGGTEFILGFDESKLPKEKTAENVRDQIIEIMRNRVDSLGIVEPEIKPIGPTSISLKMPSVTEDDKADVRKTITETAKLTFHLVHPRSAELVAQVEAGVTGIQGAEGYMLREIRSDNPDGTVRVEQVFITKTPSRVRGQDVVRAVAMYQDLQGYAVSLSFNARGAKAFGELTKENVNQRLAIVLDDKVYSAPNINEPILGGQAQITGNFSPEEANRLASVIASGDLPVNIEIDSEFGTDPTLGRDSIASGTRATLWGMIAVVVFMVGYYRFAGVVAVLALAGNILLVFGTLALSGATITLPGIAGIVLTIGMAVDANVLIFERIREELRNGKSIGNAVKSGYRRVFSTIFDANLTTLITAVILYKLGTGPIRGFAVTLSIGIVASMFTALFMTRAIFDLCLFNGWMKGLSMASFVSNPSFDFLKHRRLAFAVSAALIVLGIAVVGVRGGTILGIDFAGGTEVTFRVTGDPQPDQSKVAEVLAGAGYTDCRVGYKYAGTGARVRMLEVVMPQRSTNDEDLDLPGMENVLADNFAGAEFEHAQTNSVGSLIGQEFQGKAIIAAILAVVAIVIYVSFRFEFAYGVAAVVALIHDVLIAMGIYLLFGRQLSLPVVAALLTIMGYSLNDTIVVFDRIREDLGLLRNKSYQDIINISINQTLARTLLTSLTTLLVVVILVLFGGGAINDFALVMLIGVVVGTYSSIFVASAIVATWHKPAHVSEKKSE